MKHFFKAIMLSIITLFLYSANPLLSYSGTLDTSLNNYLPDDTPTGTVRSWDFSTTYTLVTGDYLKGFIKLREGLSVIGAPGHVSVGITEPIDGDIWLGSHGLFITDDLFLGRNPIIHGGATPFFGVIMSDQNDPNIQINLTNGPLLIKDGAVYLFTKLNGNGNRLTVDTASGGKVLLGNFITFSTTLANIELTNVNDNTFTFQPLLGTNYNVTFDNAKIFIDQDATITDATIYIKGTTQFIVDPQYTLRFIGSHFIILPESELLFTFGTHITFESSANKPAAINFQAKSSALSLDSCMVDFNAGVLDQDLLTCTHGRINITGAVKFNTTRTAGYKIIMGDGTVDGDLSLNFKALSRLSIGNKIDLQIRPPK